MSGTQHIVGLSLCGPLLLTIATAPADRIRLLLQTQDEIVLNLREESLAHHSYSSSSSSSSSSKTCPFSSSSPTTIPPSHTDIKHEQEYTNLNNKENNEEEDDEEPRSIIAPYAQLPYTDMQDCYERLVEKEGAKSLWRGYSVEWSRILVQKSLEMRLNRKGTFALRRWMSMTPQSSGGTTGWLLATAVEGTVIGAAALAVVYPLSVVHAKMATDVVRKTRRVRKVVKTHVDGSRKGAKDVKEEEKVESSTESISGDSVEWVEHTAEDNENDQEPTVSTPILEGELSVAETKDTTEKDILTTTAKTTTTYEYEYELSYKYKTFCQVFNETLASSEGYLGFYKGFSTVVASAFVSRLGLMTIYTIKSLCAGGPGGVVFSPFQVFITQTALSVLTYPLTTVGNRRMIAAPGRYSSSWEAAQQIVERQGWQALFKGVEVVVVRSVVLATLSHLLL